MFNLNIAMNPPKPEGTTRVPPAQWFAAVILGPLAEAMVDTLKTGMLVSLSGHATQRSWPALKDGQPVTYTDEKTGEQRQAWQHAAQLVVAQVSYLAADGQYYQASEQGGEAVSTVVAPPTNDRQKANIVLRGTASGIQLTPATETSQARLNFQLTESYVKWSGAAATRRWNITMWGDPAVLAHAEMSEGDKVTVLGSFSPNSYTDRLGVYQQGFNITCRQLDNFGQKQGATKAAAPQAQPQPAAPAPTEPKASTPKAARRQAQATA